MTVEHVEILVEEPSIEVALRCLLPGLLRNEISFQVYPSNGKRDLLDNLPNRLRGYARWLPDKWRLLVIVDRDDEDCDKLKKQLERIAAEAGLMTKSCARKSNWKVVNRLAIEELEAWFFGDMDAVRTAYPGVPETLEKKAAFRDPDTIKGGTWEALERVLQKAGYFKAGYRKLEAAREIARHMEPNRNRSRSFRVFCDVLQSLGS